MRSGALIKKASRYRTWILLGIALALRLVGIASRSIWYDEAFAILFARQGPAAMLYGTLAPDALGAAADIHPLGYYTLLWAWMRIFGESIVAARMLSVLIGCGVVWFGYRFAKAWFGEPASLWAGVFLAFSPFMVHYAQEIRMYGLLAFFLIAASYFYFRAMNLFDSEPPASARFDWFRFILFSALAMYTHTLAIFYLVPLALVPVFMRSRSLAWKTLLAGAGAVLLYLPWLLQIPDQLGKVRTAYWTAPPGAGRLLTTLLAFVSNLPVQPEILPFVLFTALLVPVIAILQTLRARRTKTGEPAGSPWVLLHLSFTPVILMFAVSQFIPVFIERALLPSGVMFLVWLAWALRATPIPRPVGMIASALLLTTMLLGLQGRLTYRGFPYAPYAEINESIRTAINSEDLLLSKVAIVHANKLSAFPAYLDAPDLPIRFLQDIPGSGSDTLALPTQEVIGFFAEDDIESAVDDAAAVWFIVFTQELNEFDAAGVSVHPAQAWLDSQYVLVDSEIWDDLLVFKYEQP